MKKFIATLSIHLVIDGVFSTWQPMDNKVAFKGVTTSTQLSSVIKCLVHFQE